MNVQLKENRENSPIFITARFRTGSTMLWNIFHQLPEARAYYEPLHDHLASFIEHPISPQKSHLYVKAYFDEYKDAKQAISLHKSDFANQKLYLESDSNYPELQTYIRMLVETVPLEKTAVLQFNRIDFRLGWIRHHFPQARLLHLTRNPREQWYSSLAAYKIDIDTAIDFDAYDMVTWARDLYKQFPFLATPQIEHGYQRFYYLWKLSQLAGQRLSGLSMAYEDILAEPQKYVAQILHFSNLYSDRNMETGIRLIESKPERIWHCDKNDEWFSTLEQKCELVLDELGLNQNFALMPLAEIQAGSAKYQSMLHKPENDLWAATSFKRAVISERIKSFELNWKLDQSYKNALRERDDLQTELERIHNNLGYKMISRIQAFFRALRIPFSASAALLRTKNQMHNTASQEPDIPVFMQSNGQEFDLDKIMEKIRVEVARRNDAEKYQQSLAFLENNFTRYSTKQTKTFRLIKSIQVLLQKFYIYDSVYRIARKFKKYIPKYQTQGFPITKLLEFDDKDFVRNAYKVILRREPDSIGMNHYLLKLRSNAWSKTEILARLRYSIEGNQIGAKIEGLSIRQFIASMLRK